MRRDEMRWGMLVLTNLGNHIWKRKPTNWWVLFLPSVVSHVQSICCLLMSSRYACACGALWFRHLQNVPMSCRNLRKKNIFPYPQSSMSEEFNWDRKLLVVKSNFKIRTIRGYILKGYTWIPWKTLWGISRKLDYIPYYVQDNPWLLGILVIPRQWI